MNIKKLFYIIALASLSLNVFTSEAGAQCAIISLQEKTATNATSWTGIPSYLNFIRFDKIYYRSNTTVYNGQRSYQFSGGSYSEKWFIHNQTSLLDINGAGIAVSGEGGSDTTSSSYTDTWQHFTNSQGTFDSWSFYFVNPPNSEWTVRSSPTYSSAIEDTFAYTPTVSLIAISDEIYHSNSGYTNINGSGDTQIHFRDYLSTLSELIDPRVKAQETFEAASSFSTDWTDTLSPTAHMIFASDGKSVDVIKSKWRIRYKIDAGVRYVIKYQKMIVLDSHEKASPEGPYTVEVMGNGDVQYLDMDDMTCYGSGYTSNQSKHVQILGYAPCSEGCPTIPNNGSIDVRITLGRDNGGEGVGTLLLNSKVPTSDITSPLSLSFWQHGVAEVIKSSGNLRQIKGAQVLADITSVPLTGALQIALYHGAATFSSGLWSISGLTAFSTTTVETVSDINHVRITVVDDSGTQVSNYTWTPANYSWALETGAGLKTETKVWNAGGDRLIHSISNATSLVYQEISDFATLGSQSVIITQVVGTASSARTNNWFYYTDSMSDGLKYGKVKLYIDSERGWTRYEYDSLGRPSKEVREFGTTATNAAENVSRVITFDYTPIDALDSAAFSWNEPRTMTETLMDKEIRRHHTIVTTTNRTEIEVGSGEFGTNYVMTVTTYGGGEFADRPASILRPDGTMSFFIFGSTNVTPVHTNFVFEGQPNMDQTSIDEGKVTATYIGQNGRIQCIAQTNVTGGALGSMVNYTVYTNWDSFDRPQKVIYLDGTFEEMNYGCCGMSVKVDRDGTYTYYEYDELKRLTLTKRQVDSYPHYISISNLLDAAGNTLATFRKGTDNTWMTNNSTTYNIGGEVVLSRDGLNNTTGYSNYVNGSGEWVKQTTNADGGLKIETYYQDGNLAKVTGSATFPERNEYGVESENSVFRYYVKKYKLDGSGADTSEWTKTYYDKLGNPYKTVYPDSAASQQYYNNAGQLWKTVDPDSVTNLFFYNGKGELEFQVQDISGSGTTSLSGTNRATKFVNDVISDHSTVVSRKQTLVWLTDNSNSSTVSQVVETSRDGNHTWVSNFGIDSDTEITWGSGTRTLTTTMPDSTTRIVVYTNGRLTSVTTKDSGGTQTGQTTYEYDAHGRQYHVIDARNGTTALTFNLNDQVITTTLPSADGVETPQVISYYYDNMGKMGMNTLADGSNLTNHYTLQGLLANTYGSGSYPVFYAYDTQGRMTNMVTYQSLTAGTGTATNTWIYDSQRGWNTIKRHQDGKGYTNTFTPAGRLSTQTSARSIVTTHTYDSAGELAGTSYSGAAAPSVSYTYDRLGRLKTITRDSITTTRAYTNPGRLSSESYSGGILSGLSVTSAFDNLGRRTNNATTGINAGFSYDTAGRLYHVAAGSSTAIYSYHTDSRLVSSIEFKQSSTSRMTTSKAYDYLNRLTSVSSGDDPGEYSGYGYNLANQRTSVVLNDGSWVYGYDSLGQVTNAVKYFWDSTPIPGEQFTYAFDDIGNRKSTGVGGDETASNLRSSTYTATLMNQYTNRTVPNKIDVNGAANSSSVVTVNSRLGYRKGEYFRNELLVNNSAGAVWQSITNKGSLVTGSSTKTVTSHEGHIFVPPATENFTYDVDGNLTSDGRWTNTWNGQNQLVSMEGLNTAPTGSRLKLEFTYDYLGRRIQKVVSSGWNGSTYATTATTKFLYDGWNLIAELDGSNAAIRNFVWGSDLSGTMQGAGGVGGLIAMKNSTDTHFVAYDGNGNVMNLVKASNGANAASYEYGPFGEVLKVAGSVSNPLRFSSKYQDDETDMVYYGYRFFNPSTGKWLSRDPVEEQGGINLYNFVNNHSINGFDSLGLLDGKDLFEFITGFSEGEIREGINQFEGLPVNPVIQHFEADQMRKAYSWFKNEVEVYGPVCPISEVRQNGQKWGSLLIMGAAMLTPAGEEEAAANAALKPVRANNRLGKLAEAAFHDWIKSKGYKIVAEQITVVTSKGRTVIDFVYKKGEQFFGFEVKAGRSPQRATQAAKQALVGAAESRVVGEKAAEAAVDKIQSVSTVYWK